MYDMIKAVFQLAAEGYAGVVIILLLLLLVFMLNKIRLRQAATIQNIEELRKESSKVENLSKDLSDFNDVVDKCFSDLHSFLDVEVDKTNAETTRKHSEVVDSHNRILAAASLITKDIAELKGMFNAAIAGIHKGIK